jgi:7-carboxy-7-deazaguanine synthase
VAFSDLLVTELFHSLQGETSLSGIPFAFIRLTGCNLRCAYCDSSYAFKGGTRMTIDGILAAIAPWEVKHVLLTGGEPLLQRQTPELARRLVAQGYAVSVETHGEVSIAPVAEFTRVVMDIKAPASGMSRGGYVKNLPLLKADDEIKFVIASEGDYFWARDLIRGGTLPTREILLSPVVPVKAAPGTFPGVDTRWLAERILEDRLPVRMQLQLHKFIWGTDQRGV